MKETKRDMLECVRPFFDGKSFDNIYIVKSCEYSAILFSENEAIRSAKRIIDEIRTEDANMELCMAEWIVEDMNMELRRTEWMMADFALVVTRIF